MLCKDCGVECIAESSEWAYCPDCFLVVKLGIEELCRKKLNSLAAELTSQTIIGQINGTQDNMAG